MKKAIAIFFLAVYLFSMTEANQLLKLPMFFSHFITHKHQNKNLTLCQFIRIHYLEGDVKDADYAEDMKLPFKSHNNNISTCNLFVPPSFISFLSNPKTHLLKTFSFYPPYQSFLSFYTATIWQPPRKLARPYS